MRRVGGEGTAILCSPSLDDPSATVGVRPEGYCHNVRQRSRNRRKPISSPRHRPGRLHLIFVPLSAEAPATRWCDTNSGDAVAHHAPNTGTAARRHGSRDARSSLLRGLRRTGAPCVPLSAASTAAAGTGGTRCSDSRCNRPASSTLTGQRVAPHVLYSAVLISFSTPRGRRWPTSSHRHSPSRRPSSIASVG